MGLDMSIEYIDQETGEAEELLYWRKQPALHSWFEKLAVSKGIEFESFNCIDVPLVEEDILKLKKDLKEHTLDMKASGFFWGSNDNMSAGELDEWIKERLDECDAMLSALELNIYYTSWW